MKKLKVIICFTFVFCLLFAFAACKSQPDIKEKTYYSYFDTVTTVYSYAKDESDEFEANCRDIGEIFRKYHELFDIYNEYEGVVNLCTINKNAGGEMLSVDRELVDFLLYAKELYTLTNGEMNIMMGSVLSLWHDCREAAKNEPENAQIPDYNALVAASEHTDISLLEIDEENCAVRITDALASLDVGALGKGYAAEKAAEYLEEMEISSYVLDVGGNIRIIGEKPDGSGWVTGIKDPFSSGGYAIKLRLTDTSCVTSGDYERNFIADGKKYHHIIDKDTLMPAGYFSSVTVVCRDSALADALSTALFCMSYDDGAHLVEGLEGVEVIWITAGGSRFATEGIVDLEA